MKVTLEIENLLKFSGDIQWLGEIPIIPPSPYLGAKGKLLWKATHETGNLSEWQTSGGNYIMNGKNIDVNEVSSERTPNGNRSIKTAINAGLNQMASTQFFRHSPEGEPNVNPDAIYECWYKISNGFDMEKVSWHNIMQWKAKFTNGKSYPVFTLGFNVRGGKGSGGKNYIELRNTAEHFNGKSYNIEELIESDVPIGNWFKIKARYIQGSIGLGRIIVWLDDVMIYDVSGVTTKPIRNNTNDILSEMSWSVNNYAQGLKPSQSTLLIGDPSIHLPANHV